MLASIQTILNWSPPPRSPPPFNFSLSKEAANQNFKTLKSTNFDLDGILRANPNSPTAYGSEFRPPHILTPLLASHPAWPKIARLLSNGTEYSLSPVDPAQAKEDANHAIAYGNHKSASNQASQKLSNLMAPDVQFGWLLPLLPEHVPDIPNAVVAPMGVALQDTLAADGSIVPKERPTHDLSFPGRTSGTSINSRIIEDSLEPCNFGKAHRRILHYIVGCRLRHPQARIFIQKVDWKSAYRRQHLNGATCFSHLTQIVWAGVTFLAMALRLPFGGKPCASEWSCISECVADITDNLLSCEEWDPKVLFSPLQRYIPPPQPLPDSIPFKEAKPLFVQLPPNDRGVADVYIDDMLTIAPDLPGNIERLNAAGPLAVHIFARPPATDETLPREPMLAKNKLSAEGGLSEVRTILGWVYNTRDLTISLPRNKYIAWSAQIQQILEAGSILPSELDTLIGRLNHTASINTMYRHFLGRLRKLADKAPRHKRVSIPPRVRNDLTLWLCFLSHAHRGFSMNALSYRLPTHVFRSDACETGLGGFSHKGRAWRFKLPQELQGRAHINLLEYIGCVVSIWVDYAEGNIPPESCILAMGDNTTSLGWMKKSNFAEKDLVAPDRSDTEEDMTAKLAWSRKLAGLISARNDQLYTQWIAGGHNTIADSLSRDWHVTDHHLTSSLLSSFPSQVPRSFKIQPLPTEIASFICSTLQKLPVRQGRYKPPKTSGIDHGTASPYSYNISASQKTHSWTISRDGKGTSFSQPLLNFYETKSSSQTPNQTEEHKIRIKMSQPFEQAQSKVPLATWLKPSVQLTEQTPDSTKT